MSFETADLYDGPHVSVVGATGSGKTTLAIRYYENVPVGRGIFIHQDPNDSMKADARINYENGDSWDPSVLQGNRLIEIVMPLDEETAREELDQIQHDLFALGQSMGHDEPRFYVFVDEVHEYAPIGSPADNALVRMAKRGRRHNIRLWMISQSPADVSKKALKQARYHVIFAIGTFSQDYFKTYKIPFEKVRNAVSDPESHKFVVWDDFKLHGPYKLDL